MFILKKGIEYVSIHTPTQGVTAGQAQLQRDWHVSIHTPTQGVTLLVIIFDIGSGFNPHTHAGCDLPLMYCKVLHSVSIHTPTQGVTIGGWSSVININVSIHTPTQGVT